MMNEDMIDIPIKKIMNFKGGGEDLKSSSIAEWYGEINVSTGKVFPTPHEVVKIKFYNKTEFLYEWSISFITYDIHNRLVLSF